MHHGFFFFKSFIYTGRYIRPGSFFNVNQLHRSLLDFLLQSESVNVQRMIQYIQTSHIVVNTKH